MVHRPIDNSELEVLEYSLEHDGNLNRETILRVVAECLHRVPEGEFEDAIEEKNYLETENENHRCEIDKLESKIDTLKEKIEELRDENKILKRNADKLRDKVAELEGELEKP